MDSGKMTGSFVDSDTYDLLFDDGCLYGTRTVDALTLFDFFQQMIGEQEDGSAESETTINVTIHLCEDGRIRFREDTQQSNTVDFYFVRVD